MIADSIQFYIDGLEEGNSVKPDSGNTFDGISSFLIGGTINPMRLCQCDLAEMEVFSKALNQQEVINSFNRY